VVDARSPLVSVIVNCYNGERYLQEALDSIAAQTMADFEIIFWDNGSIDRSAEIAHAFGPRLRYFRAQQTSTLGAARNLAIAEARGEFVAFLDVDDRWYPETLQRLLDAMPPDAALVYAGVQHITADGAPLMRAQPAERTGALLDPLLRQFDINVPALLLRRSSLLAAGLSFDPAVTASEEYCLFVQLSAEAPMRSIPTIVADYRVHAGALTAASSDKWADERFYTLERLVARHPELRTTHADALRVAAARGHYYRARRLMVAGDRSAARRELAQALGTDARYYPMYALTFLPAGVWHAVHAWRSGREITSAVDRG